MNYLEVRGTNRQMGRSYGEHAREAIRRDMELRIERSSWHPTPESVKAARSVIQTYHPDILDELEGIAEGSHVDVDLLLSIHHVDVSDRTDLCTPIFLTMSPGGPLVAKNSDLPAE